jgi:hypothetical protein
MWEIFAMGATPFTGMSGVDAAAAISTGVHPTPPPNCPPKLYASTVEICFALKADDRPMFDHMVTVLNKL